MRPPWPLQFSTLNICLTALYPNRYVIRSLPADMLFNPMKYAIRSQTKPPPIREVFSYSPCAGVGSAVLRSNVYIVGGLHPDFFMKNPTATCDVSYFDGRNSGKTVFAYNTSPRLPFTTVPDMISPKTDPLVLAVAVGEEDRLYVLSDNMYPYNRPPVFECYTLSTNSWEQLDPPPFLNPKSKYFDTWRYYSYATAIIGTSICVSTDRTSFKFDVEKKIWEPCMLFEDYAEDSYTPRGCGPPFRFNGNAVLFDDDVLLCRVPYLRGGVIAYKIKGGKVVDSQSLIMPRERCIPPDSQSSCIADFGNGLFCQVFTGENDEPPSILTVKPFFIKKKAVLKPGDFLHFEVINEFKYAEKDNDGWYPMISFSS